MDLSRAGETTTPILAHELGGDLPCARCRYNLRGLSIRSVCPECATPIRATLLARLDPRAGELQPIFYPRLTAAGIVVWSTAALGAALLTWVQRIAGLLDENTPVGVAWSVIALTAVSGLGAVALVYPHSGLQARRGIVPAILGVLAYIPLLALLFTMHMRLDRVGVAPYGEAPAGDIKRLLAHLLAMLCIAFAAIGLRPNAQILAARSLLMRTGRTDRQTLIALAAVAGVAGAGSGIRLMAHAFSGPTAQLIDQAGQTVVLVGSVLLTIGLAWLSFDTWRLAPVILEPPLSLAHVLAPRSMPKESTP